MRTTKFSLLVVALVALTACAQPGQPPNAGNLIVGTAEILAANTLLKQADARLGAAYTAGKIPKAQYLVLYGEEVNAQTALDNLGQAILLNQPVTQAQVNAALLPMLTDLAKLVPAGGVGPPLTQPG